MSTGRRAWWDREGIADHTDILGLSSQEMATLNAAVDRVEAGYSPFDLTTQVPRRRYRQVHEAMTAHIFGRHNYPVYTRHIDHSPT